LTQGTSESRIHDLLAVVLGAFAALSLITSPWNVDTEGPDPFYKGPLIFPILVLSMMILASLPACLRMARPPLGAGWRLDGDGLPLKTLAVLVLLGLSLSAIPVIGVEVSALGFLVAGLRLAGHRGPVRLILVPLVVTGLVVLVFKHFLGVFFPTPFLLEWVLEG
jgi:hypothetical protein